MDQKIKIDQIIRTQRRSIALFIDPQGRLVIRAPLAFSDKLIETFVEKNRQWILAKQAQVKANQAHNPVVKYQEGEKFLYLGIKYPLTLVDRQLELLKFSEGFFLKRSALPDAPALFEKWYRSQAQHWIAKRVAYFARAHGFEYNQVRIKNIRSRWGSCSSKKNLNFNLRLILAPQDVIDYVVVHELVHLVHKNHSQAFWQGVGKILPGYKARRDWLKANGGSLIF